MRTLKIIADALMPFVRLAGKAIAALFTAVQRYPNSILCCAAGIGASYVLGRLPGFLHYLSFAAIIATVVLTIRAVWLDLGAQAAERRIAERTVDALHRAVGKGGPP